MKKLNKKAMEAIVVIILALVIFVVLLALATVINKSSMFVGGKNVCRASVIAADKAETAIDINCEINNAGELKLQGKTKDDQKEDAMKQIAELTRDCWWQFGEGKLDPFKKKLVTRAVACFVCSKFSFETEGPITEAEFMDFLKNKKITEEMSYHRFLKGSLPEEGQNVLFVDSIDFKIFSQEITQYYNHPTGAALYPKNDYGVIFYSINPEILAEVYSKFLGMIKIIKNIGVPKADIYIVPYENIEKLSCDRLQG